jgi:hypothetical protein
VKITILLHGISIGLFKETGEEIELKYFGKNRTVLTFFYSK